ncbi:hypothetical protein ACTWP5_16400 [Streptomyces sp. 4N509B]|uniref:hypothetical protein n=1 Tax=Streptomyces sp. 4N509B TaxID=3457413 RepID=UPI003FD55A12
MVGHRGVLLVAEGTWVTVALGGAVLALPALGVWFLWRGVCFVRAAHRLARELGAEGGSHDATDAAEDSAPATGARAASARAAFERRRAEVEASPGDWRCWFRLAVAYHEARDTPRARRAITHAIRLHAAQRR